MGPLKKLQIGKNGLTPEFIHQTKKLFETENLIKISILKSICRDKDEARKMADELIEALGKNFKYRLVGYVLTINKFRRPVRE